MTGSCAASISAKLESLYGWMLRLDPSRIQFSLLVCPNLLLVMTVLMPKQCQLTIAAVSALSTVGPRTWVSPAFKKGTDFVVTEPLDLLIEAIL